MTDGRAHSSDTIATAEGRFTAATAGPADGPLVILLHGDPQRRHTWCQQVPALGAAGYRAVAPDQRGYSTGVRRIRPRGSRPTRSTASSKTCSTWPTPSVCGVDRSTWSATTGAAT
jgi:hypothetical protein